jgi:hypothetical protein
VLAYVFWHVPGPGAGGAAYERALATFHEVLQHEPPDGLLGSAALRIIGAPWLPGSEGYEDWYLLAGFAELGTLNRAAVAGPRQAPHDDVALRSGHGAGGVYASWVGSPNVAGGPATWCSKSPGATYEQLRAALSTPTWQRQLVLGPAPEFRLAGDGPVPAGAEVVATTSAEVVWATPPATRSGP